VHGKPPVIGVRRRQDASRGYGSSIADGNLNLKE
jgi:hypothetical protein